MTSGLLQRKPVRRRYESPGMYSDDDANSDASSACSERSYGSRNGGVPHYLRQTEDVAEVLNHCASSNWSERKEGLLGLQNLLKSQRILRWVGPCREQRLLGKQAVTGVGKGEDLLSL